MMGDLFCDGVNEEWIKKVLETVKEHSQISFLLLTKNPKRMTEFEFPDNAWVGATVDRRFRIKDTEEALKKIKAKVKMLSCEPLLEDLTEGSTRDLPSLLKMVDWVIIGAQNSATGVPEIQPKWEWVENLLIQARKAGCLVYFRPELKVKPQEYPVPSDFLQNNSLKERVSNLKESISKDEFNLFKSKLKEIQSHYNDNGKNECVRNYQLLHAIEQKEREVNGNGSDTGDKDEKDSIEESVQVHVTTN